MCCVLWSKIQPLNQPNDHNNHDPQQEVFHEGEGLPVADFIAALTSPRLAHLRLTEEEEEEEESDMEAEEVVCGFVYMCIYVDVDGR